RSGGSTLTLTDNSGYTGSTELLGGVTTLVDQGRLSGGGAITLTGAVLRWDDSGIQAMNNRLSSSSSPTNANSSDITLNGGGLYFVSRTGTNGVATFGDLTIGRGASIVSANVGNSGVGTATLSFGSLTRTSPDATITFHGSTGIIGQNPFIKFSSVPTLTNG